MTDAEITKDLKYRLSRRSEESLFHLQTELQELIIKIELRGRTPCQHITLRHASLPCPHPECGFDSSILVWMETPQWFLGSWLALDPATPPHVLKHLYRRVQFAVSGQAYWGWAPYSVPDQSL